jgi:hypothetical protein
MKPQTANTISIIVYFIAGLISLNFLDTLLFHILGIAFLIAGVYGIVAIIKTGLFIFEK